MLKKLKAHKSLQNLPCRKDSIQCSVCNNFSTGMAFYFCNSGHAICEYCQQPDGSEGRKDSGDFLQKKCVKSTHNHNKANKNRPTLINPLTKDLASGDHDKPSFTTNKEQKSKSKTEKETKSLSVKKNGQKEELETVVEYKNLNYQDDKSSTSSLRSDTSKVGVECIANPIQSSDMSKRVCPRPVSCPVEECHKMIALDSVMLHFYFDHSKVPRMNLNSCTARQVQIKPNSLSTMSQCLNIFVLQDINEMPLPIKDSSNLNIGATSDNNFLLLMGAKIQLDKIKPYDEKKCTTAVTIRNVSTQTDMIHSSVLKKKSNLSLSIKKSELYKPVAQDEFDYNEVLLLWLCRLEDSEDSYSITLIRKDKKQGFSYIGEATHIRDEQTPSQMYQRSACLIVNGTSVNKLLDEKNQLNVLINVLE